MFRPKAAYSRLTALPMSGHWLLFRRPLLVAFLLGCAISLLTAGSLTLRLVTSATVTWSFVPLLEMAALAVVWRLGSRRLSLPHAMDLFFTGHAPWSLWLIGFGAYWSSFPQPRGLYVTEWLWLLLAGGIMAWSACIDFWFHRYVLESSPSRAVRHLLFQRAFCWTIGILLFGYGSLWADLVERLP